MESKEEENVVVPNFKPMIVPKLFDLCLVTAAEEIKNLSDGPNLQAVPTLSQKLFELLHVPNDPLPQELVHHIKQKFKIHNIVLGRRNMDEMHRDLAYSQKIESLALLDIKDGGLYVKNGPKAGKKQKGRPYRINIVSCLRRFLNPESRKVLTNLSIAGSELTFQPGWTKEIQQLLPAIRSIDLSGCYVTNEELATLCKSGLLLNSLSIARTEVNCLNGIEILSALKVLVLEDLMFKKPEQIQGLFELKQLEILYFSYTEGFSDNAKLLSECRGTLPKLTFLDISGSILNDIIVNRLLAQFPKLGEIAAIYTNFEKHLGPYEFVRDVKIYGLRDLGACVESLGIYMSHPSWCGLVIREISNLVYYDCDSQDKEDLFNCAKKCIGIVESGLQTFNNRLLALRCLLSTDKQKVIKLIPVEQRSRLIFTLCNIIRTAEWVSDDFFFTLPYAFVAEASDFFDKTDVLAGTNLEKLVCDTLVQLMQRITGLCQFFLLPCFSILTKHQAFLSNLDENVLLNIKTSIHQVLRRWTNGRQFLCLKILRFLAVMLRFEYTNITIDYKLVCDIYRVLNVFSDSAEATEIGFNCLELLYSKLVQEDRQSVFHPGTFSVITKCLRSKASPVRKAAVKFLMKEHKWNVERENYQPYTPEELNPLLSDIDLMIDSYGDFDSRYVNVLFVHIIITTSNEEIATFGEWVLQHFPEFNMDV